MKVLAISGSLRAASINTALLRALARLAPADIAVELFRDLGKLPLFNPDLEIAEVPVVASFQAQLIAADAVLIASPEYAHGVTGSLKNALDWMVASEAFVNKPVALLNASPRASLAQASLRETLTTMSARVIDAACIAIPLLGARLGEDEIAAHPTMAPTLMQALRALQAAVMAE